VAAEANFQMFWASLRPLLEGNTEALARLDEIRDGFAEARGQALDAMWASKLGLIRYDAELVQDLLQLMVSSKADYTIFFRRLSDIPEHVSALQESFYVPCSEELEAQWKSWLQRWRHQVTSSGDPRETAAAMQRVNPKVTWREWLIAPAYEQAAHGDYGLVRELEEVFSHPYDALAPELAATYDRLKPREFFNAGGVSHYSCSS
jgi:uncharacterized protein YdiU (UPF0061 family)